MDTYESWCDTHGTYPLQPDLTGCPYCRIEQLEAQTKEAWEHYDAILEDCGDSKDKRIKELEARLEKATQLIDKEITRIATLGEKE
jgi:enamine deaminase RidA (YjgF/YER057c/UK114 family)